jgi:hypothetical protein
MKSLLKLFYELDLIKRPFDSKINSEPNIGLKQFQLINTNFSEIFYLI